MMQIRLFVSHEKSCYSTSSYVPVVLYFTRNFLSDSVLLRAFVSSSLHELNSSLTRRNLFFSLSTMQRRASAAGRLFRAQKRENESIIHLFSPSGMVDCLICGKPTAATHMGMDACRACTVFFRLVWFTIRRHLWKHVRRSFSTQIKWDLNSTISYIPILITANGLATSNIAQLPVLRIFTASC